jgi:hypothetical protein
VRNHQLCHDAYNCNSSWWAKCEPFPTKRQNFEHVGAVYDPDGVPLTLSKAVAPEECRGNPSWIYG